MKTNEKDTKQGVIPALRFPEFNNHFWHIKELCKIATLINERARNGNYTPMSVTSGVGLVPQKEKFGRDISGNQYSSYFVIRRGDFAYNKSATNLYPEGYISMLKNLGIAAVPNSIFTCFSVNREEILPEYLNYLFEDNYHGKWLRKFIEVGARTHGSLSIDTKKLFELPIVFPSINEQQKIADCLSSIDALIKVTENKIDELKAHKKGLMQRLFPTEGKTVPQYRFPKFKNAGEWLKVPLFKVGEVLQGYGFPETYQGKTDGKYPFYKVSDISRSIQTGSNFISVAANYINDEDIDTLRIKTLPAGTTIFARIGEAIRLNRRVITTQESIIDNNTAGVKAIPEKATDLFLFYTLLQINFINFAGGVVPAVTKLAIENIQIYCPPTKEEQQKIADCLSSIDDLIMAQTNRLEALKTHKKGLMQQLFPNINDC